MRKAISAAAAAELAPDGASVTFGGFGATTAPLRTIGDVPEKIGRGTP